jgi:YD repeat-containing protein
MKSKKVTINKTKSSSTKKPKISKRTKKVKKYELGGSKNVITNLLNGDPIVSIKKNRGRTVQKKYDSSGNLVEKVKEKVRTNKQGVVTTKLKFSTPKSGKTLIKEVYNPTTGVNEYTKRVDKGPRYREAYKRKVSDEGIQGLQKSRNRGVTKKKTFFLDTKTGINTIKYKK